MHPAANEDDAEVLGRLAMLRGEPLELNPFDASTLDLWFAWDHGWRDEHKRAADARQAVKMRRAAERLVTRRGAAERSRRS